MTTNTTTTLANNNNKQDIHIPYVVRLCKCGTLCDINIKRIEEDSDIIELFFIQYMIHRRNNKTIDLSSKLDIYMKTSPNPNPDIDKSIHPPISDIRCALCGDYTSHSSTGIGNPIWYNRGRQITSTDLCFLCYDATMLKKEKRNYKKFKDDFHLDKCTKDIKKIFYDLKFDIFDKISGYTKSETTIRYKPLVNSVAFATAKRTFLNIEFTENELRLILNLPPNSIPTPLPPFVEDTTKIVTASHGNYRIRLSSRDQYDYAIDKIIQAYKYNLE